MVDLCLVDHEIPRTKLRVSGPSDYGISNRTIIAREYTKPSQIVPRKSPIGINVDCNLVHSFHVSECYPCVPGVEFINAPLMNDPTYALVA